MNKGSLYTRGFRHIRLSAFRYRLIKNAFAGPKSFWGFAVMGPLNTMREYDFVFSFVLHPKGIQPDLTMQDTQLYRYILF